MFPCILPHTGWFQQASQQAELVHSCAQQVVFTDRGLWLGQTGSSAQLHTDHLECPWCCTLVAATAWNRLSGLFALSQCGGWCGPAFVLVLQYESRRFVIGVLPCILLLNTQLLRPPNLWAPAWLQPALSTCTIGEVAECGHGCTSLLAMDLTRW